MDPYRFKMIPRGLTWRVKDVLDIVSEAQVIPELQGMKASDACEGGFMWPDGNDIRTQWSDHVHWGNKRAHDQLETQIDEQGFPYIKMQPKFSVSLTRLAAFMQLVSRQGHRVEYTVGFRYSLEQAPSTARVAVYGKYFWVCRRADRMGWAKESVYSETSKAFYDIFCGLGLPVEIATMILRLVRSMRARRTLIWHFKRLNREDRRRVEAMRKSYCKTVGEPAESNEYRLFDEVAYDVCLSSSVCYVCGMPTKKIGRFCLEHLKYGFFMETPDS